MLNLPLRIPRAARPAAAGAALLLATAPVLANDPAGSDEPPPRPKYEFLRQDEDWSRFEPGDDLFDPIKHVDLDDEGDVWVSFGGRIEARFEAWEDFAFASPNDDTFTVSRALLHADLHVGQRFRLFTEGKTAQSTDRDLPGGRRTLDMDTLALQQLFAEMPFELGESQRVRVRLGRQMLSLGRQRVVSPLPWGNTLRTWDGLAVEHWAGDWHTTALYTAFVPVDKTDFNEHDGSELLYGVYARRVPMGSPSGIELYALGSTRDSNTVFNGTMGSSRRYTFGTRAWTPFGSGFDVETEGAWQIGEVGSGDVNAGFATLELGYKPKEGLWKHRWFLGLDWASGDDGTGGDVGTYDQLYPLGHAYLGFSDYIGRQNIVSANVGVGFAPTSKLKVRAAWNTYYLENRHDALYNAGGGVLRAPGSFNSDHVGHDIDLLANYSFDTHLSGYLGYSHFMPGDAIADSGPSEDSDFFYLGLAYTF